MTDSRLITDDCRAAMRGLISEGVRVQMCVTSPPYYGLRDYGHVEQLGLERTPEEYVANMVQVFGLVRDLLADDGTLWLNLGDSYAGSFGNAGGRNRGNGTQREITVGSVVKDQAERNGSFVPPGSRGFRDAGIKMKDLLGIPWRVAFALQADGWFLRQDIIWHKPNPMPESVTDRCTKAHEYVFLLSKSARYYYDQEAIAEPVAESTVTRLAQPTLDQQVGSDRVPGKTNGRMKAVPPRFGGQKYGDSSDEKHRTKSGNEYTNRGGKRNRRSVWTVPTRPYAGSHFAVFPPDLIKPCVLAGSRSGDTVLDPFFGSGTTGQVCEQLGRRWIGIDLNPEYRKLQTLRTAQIGIGV